VRRMPLGVFGAEVTTKQARVKAERLRGCVVDGRDPVLERDAAKYAAIAAEAEAKRLSAETAFTFRRLIEDWERLHLLGLRQSYRRDAMGRLRLHLVGFLDRAASAITRSDAVRELDRIALEAGETTARRVMGYARSAYGWSRRRGSVETNPFDDLPQIGREVRRERVLTDSEIGRIWNAAAALGAVHGGFARLLLLTLARRDEVARMSWGEIASDLSTWTLPALRAKNRKAHFTHLAEPARAILADLRRGDASDLVFVTPSGKGLTTFSYIARKLAQHGEVEGWRLHDFRRSGVTALAAMGFAPHVCDRLLGHVQGTIRGVAAIYQRHDFAAERTAALDAWAAHVLACAGGDAIAGNVVPLSRAS
jgi:site-specific recombinase XerD